MAGVMTLRGVHFMNCNASTFGGALYLQTGLVEMIGGSITFCRTYKQGSWYIQSGGGGAVVHFGALALHAVNISG